MGWIEDMRAEGLSTYSLTPMVAEGAARLRASHNLRTPDAIQMATALDMGATCFLTNDARLPDLPGMKRLLLDDLRQGPAITGP